MRLHLSFIMLTLTLATPCFICPQPAQAIPAEGHRVMVSGPSPNSPAIAREIKTAGGNIVDVTVAVALGLSVTQPYYASFGGGGLAVIKIGKEIHALDFREMAPQATGSDTFLKAPERASLDGGLAVGVPGIPAGLWELHKKYGKLPWKKVIAPAIRLATDGFNVSGEWVHIVDRSAKRMNDNGRKVFLGKDEKHLLPGDTLKQPALARLLKKMSTQGAGAFYSGENAKDIVATTSKSNGVMTLDDLKKYKVRWLEPIVSDYNGYKVYLMPPPSSGGVVIAQALKLVEKSHLIENEPLSVGEFHTLIEILKLSYKGRWLLGDPDFAKNPIAELLDNKALDHLASLIKKDKAIDPETLLTSEERASLKKAKNEKEQTTNISAIDDNGDAIAMTVTLNGDFGSGLVTEKSGVALNNEMDDFTTHPFQPNMFGLIQGDANSIHPGARPLSSMSPTIVTKDDQAVLAVGAPGGPRITSAVFQVLYRVLGQNLDLDRAIQTARVHHQFLPNFVYTDLQRLPPETLAALKAKGHEIKIGSTAKVYAVKRIEGGILQGASDDRGEGAAGGF